MNITLSNKLIVIGVLITLLLPIILTTGVLYSKKDTFLIYYAIKSNNSDICNYVSINETRVCFISTIKTNNGDAHACDVLESVYDQDVCYLLMANKIHDPNICKERFENTTHLSDCFIFMNKELNINDISSFSKT